MTAGLDPVKVLIADDHALFREGLRHLLNSDSRTRVIGEAADGIDAVEQAVASHPDVVLMDLTMPLADGIEATRVLSSMAPEIDVVLLSASTDRSTIGLGFASGAKAFVYKDVSLQDVIRTILGVRSARRSEQHRAHRELSNRELDVLTQVARGLSNKQIARLLGISEKTVRNHMSRTFEKLRVRNRTEAVLNAVHAGLLNV